MCLYVCPYPNTLSLSLLLVDNRDGYILLGTVMRKVITTLIQQRAFTPSCIDDPTKPDSTKISPLLNWAVLERSYPRYPDIADLQLTESDR